jgi:type IV secretory pathway VirB2 component (pilin)
MVRESNFEGIKRFAYFFCLVVFCSIVLPNIVFVADAFASSSASGLTQVLSNVVAGLTGPIGKTIATIAVIVLGIGLFTGKLSWPLALATAIGIGMIFGSSSIVTWLTGNITS